MSRADVSDETQSYDTRVAHQVLLDGLEAIKESMKDASIERKVEVGSVLWDLGDRVKDVLDGIKADVRRAAIKELNGQTGNASFEGDDMGSANVTVLAARLKVPKGKDFDSIKSVLGSRFSLFFEEVTTYRPHKEFENRVAQVEDPLEQKTLLESVERQELTPRVSFRRDKPSRRDGQNK